MIYVRLAWNNEFHGNHAINKERKADGFQPPLRSALDAEVR
ncbi:hypothetical protein SAMN05444515_102254 [Ectothiorhodospira marina]|uniref:Uncharacterized protein n=1 Tax=Ectothiorhodospira marina TaxID=1396821 RepID=A0A1H7HSP4_9GAMM|nr:hypothetical protein SAMN05444515_102254 [Ectothiorhodospira marina]